MEASMQIIKDTSHPRVAVKTIEYIIVSRLHWNILYFSLFLTRLLIKNENKNSKQETINNKKI